MRSAVAGWCASRVVWILAGLGGTACASAHRCDLHECHLSPRETIAKRVGAAERASRTPASSQLGPPGAVARSVRHGAIDCFEAGAHREEAGEEHRLAFCEGSALVYDGERLLLASDKPVPGPERTSVFEVPFSAHAPGERAKRYLEGEPYARARKLEDATVTPSGERVFLTTGFDRVRAEDASWDGYNVLLTYPVDRPGAARVVTGHAEAAPTSVDLREVFRPHLPTEAYPGGAPYFKIEGVAAAPGRRLLFGVRELGASYRLFSYAVIILEARWREDADGRVSIDPSTVRRIYRMDDLRIGGRTVGLSSLEYDRHSGQFYLLTSYENEQPGDAQGRTSLGGFLWTLSETALAEGRPPLPVVDAEGQPLRFFNKPEGLTVIGENQLLVLFDDDRVLECGHPGHVHRRRPHQTPIGYIELGPPPPAVASAQRHKNAP